MHEPLTGRSLVEFADKHLDATFARIEAGTLPVWEAQAELGRTLISLSSGALVLSITLVQFFADRITDPAWAWALPLSWILFALTVLLGAVRFAWGGQARSWRIYCEAKRSHIRMQIAALEPGPELSDQFDNILATTLDNATGESLRAVRIYDRLTKVMVFAFAFALIALLIFALKNLPS